MQICILDAISVPYMREGANLGRFIEDVDMNQNEDGYVDRIKMRMVGRS